MREDETGKHFEHEMEAGSIERFIRALSLGVSWFHLGIKGE